MKFRLTYEGRLRATNRDALEGHSDPLSVHKHEIRERFHAQLKELWATDKFLSACVVDGTLKQKYAPLATAVSGRWAGQSHGAIPLSKYLAERHSNRGFNFVPLVAEEFGLLCSLDILFLRRDIPGSVLHAGDIDNRIKTVIDALRPPKNPNEFDGKGMQPIVPKDGQDPFYVLLEDDKQVSHFSVETDTLLDPIPTNPEDAANVRLVITVELRPYHVTMFNLSFA